MVQKQKLRELYRVVLKEDLKEELIDRIIYHDEKMKEMEETIALQDKIIIGRGKLIASYEKQLRELKEQLK